MSRFWWVDQGRLIWFWWVNWGGFGWVNWGGLGFVCGLIGVALGCGSAIVTVVVFYLLLWLIILLFG